MLPKIVVKRRKKKTVRSKRRTTEPLRVTCAPVGWRRIPKGIRHAKPGNTVPMVGDGQGYYAG